MSRLMQVLREKNRLEREDKKRRQQEMQDIRQDTAYRAKLYDDMQSVRVALEDPSVEYVRIQVPENCMTRFMRAAYSDEMAEYQIEIDQNTAVIRRRMIQL